MEKFMKFIIIILFTLCSFIAFGKDNNTTTVQAEALIVNDDIAAARIQAEARARWAAIEALTPVTMNVSTVIHNAEILDESIKSEITAMVKSFEILDEGVDDGSYWLEAKVTVEPVQVGKFMADLAQNTTIAVYLPAIMPDGTVEEFHPLAQGIVNELINKGFNIVELASVLPQETTASFLNAAETGNIKLMQALATDYMAGSALIGKLSVVNKGSNVGYMRVNFSILDGMLSYRLVGDKQGKRQLLLSDSAVGRGQGATPEAALYALSRSMASKNSAVLAGKVAESVMGATQKSVRVVLLANTDLRAFHEFRDTIKNTSWVLNVREIGMDTLVIDYPEKIFYLAAIIGQNGYRVRDFTDREVFVYPK
jgi:hypothetical protein